MSSSLLNYFPNEWNRLTVEFENLQKDTPFWFATSREYEKVFHAIAITAISCFTIWITMLKMYDSYFPKKETDTLKRTKTCYQITNLCFNLAVGCLGAYYHYWVLPTLPAYNATSSIEQIPNLFDEFYLMPAMQLGYQVWSIPIGIFYVSETKEMILHHCGVVVASSCGAFSNFGFRYWLPFFLGVFELSSVPLAIVNTFKVHRDVAKRYPLCTNASRASFVVSFLYIRVWKWLPVGPLYMRNNFFLFLTTDGKFTKLFVLVQFLCGVYLGYLQMYWAVIVVKLAFGSITGKKKKA
mmetsp:Transcript_10578/g.22292  ORF Transcript_10578/g.22292 Transcript_10578/m.22292 type:complete len:296 (-) Transcript_10578:2233-3120(-)